MTIQASLAILSGFAVGAIATAFWLAKSTVIDPFDVPEETETDPKTKSYIDSLWDVKR